MKPIVIELNEYGNVELTKEKLQEMLDEAYAEGKKDGSVSFPYISTNPVTVPLKDYITCTPSICRIVGKSLTEEGRFGD